MAKGLWVILCRIFLNNNNNSSSTVARRKQKLNCERKLRKIDPTLRMISILDLKISQNI